LIIKDTIFYVIVATILSRDSFIHLKTLPEAVLAPEDFDHSAPN
jgi:hypothetical protein